MRTDRACLLDILDAIAGIEKWRLVIGMRHHLVHGYFDVDPDIVWTAISDRIPELKARIDVALATDNSVRSEE